MMKRYIHILLVCLMALTACEAEQYRTELDEVQMELDELKQRLDEFCARFNTNLAAIKSIVEASRTNDYISGVKPLIENGVEVGYVLTLTQGGSVAVYHGKDAEDGALGADMTTPAIGVRMDENGFWCWTSGGEWLLGPDGEKIRAEAVVPQFKIQDRYWYVSYDKGKTWVKLQRAAGADGVDGAPGVDAPDGNDAHCVFEDVSLTETEVIFRLLSGEVFTLPRHGRLDVVFDVQDYEANVFAGAEIKVNYTLKNATALTKVSVSSDGNYTVRIEKTSDSAGSIFIQCPDVYKDGYVNFIMADGNGYASVRVLNFYESRMEFADGLEYRIPSEGGKVTVPYAANFNYSLVVDDQSKSWLSLVKTKAIMETAEIEISASANMESYTRVGRIYVKADNSDQAYAEIIVNQASSVFTIDKAKHTAPVEGGDLLSTITSGDGLSAVVQGVASSWITCSVVNTVDNIYELKIKAYPNYGAARVGEIKLYSADGAVYHGTVEIHQNAMEVERPEYMVFVVKTNMFSDGYVYLPLAGNLDCHIDWGDGSQELVKRQVSTSSSDKVSHKYDVQTPTEFVVRISGVVPQLSSANIPVHSIIEVKQWGLTGLTSLDSAFKGNQRLITIATDKAGSFGQVNSFASMFYECVSLVSLPDGLLDSAENATSFASFCYGCTSLQYIPSGIFGHCKEVNTFASAFYGCSALRSIPSALFAGCSKVTTFDNAFRNCTLLKYIPSDVFQGCSSVTSFADTFVYCTSIESVPEGLFDDCPNVTSFYYTFWQCASLAEIPVSLFDKHRWIQRCQYLFSGCPKLQGESPYTMLNGNKVHLYERENYTDYFVVPVETLGCFGTCRKLTDYSSIPSTWR